MKMVFLAFSQDQMTVNRRLDLNFIYRVDFGEIYR